MRGRTDTEERRDEGRDEGVRQISSSSLFEMVDQNREMRRTSFLTAALMAAV